MADYDIEKAFKAIEDELIASMMRNLDHHRAEETKEGYNWEQWQVKQLEALERYKKANADKFTSTFSNINKQIDAMISAAKTAGETDQEQKILRAIKRGFTGAKKVAPGLEAQFFRLNDAKLNALITATTNDLAKAEQAMLRFANDQYRKIIFNAQVYANTGGTYEKAVDMATKAFISAGINCIQYSNGSRHNIKEYAKMAIQTANKRAYLTGEGQKRQEWGVATVRINKRTHACPKCLPFVGKVLIDDVWSGGKADGVHMTMSYAMSQGLYHPNCRDIHSTYFEGISSEATPYTREEVEKIAEQYQKEQEANYAKHQAEKYDRLSKNSLDKDNQKKYGAIAEKWEERVTEESLELEIPEIEIEEFVPAKTIEEAEEFAKQFVDTSQFGSVGLSYKGIGLDLANEINSTLQTFFSTFDVDKLGGVAAPAKNTALGKQITAHAGYVPVRNSLIFNRDTTKNVNSFLDALSKDKQWVDEYLKHPEKFDMSKLSQRVVNVLNAAQESGRATVPQTAREAINHELGHFITKYIPKEDIAAIEKEMSKYANKVSGYACENVNEYIAESFASYMKGEGKIDPKLEEAFERLKKKDKILEKKGNSSIIKNVELPPETYTLSGMTQETANAISEAFDKLKEEYDVKINNFAVESLGKEYKNVPFQFVPVNRGVLSIKLVINKDYYFNDSKEAYTARILRNYNSGALASKSIEDLIAHEFAHIMTFQDCNMFGEFRALEEEVRGKFIKGMSNYADAKFDGAETIAEAFVRYRRGEQLPDNIMELLEKYVLRWKK